MREQDNGADRAFAPIRHRLANHRNETEAHEKPWLVLELTGCDGALRHRRCSGSTQIASANRKPGLEHERRRGIIRFFRLTADGGSQSVGQAVHDYHDL